MQCRPPSGLIVCGCEAGGAARAAAYRSPGFGAGYGGQHWGGFGAWRAKLVGSLIRWLDASAGAAQRRCSRHSRVRALSARAVGQCGDPSAVHAKRMPGTCRPPAGRQPPSAAVPPIMSR